MKIPARYQVLDADALAKLLGYTRSTIYTHVSRERYDKIPPPSIRLVCWPLWYRGDVEDWREKVQKEGVFLKWREIYQQKGDVSTD
jgi:predicted DNA-binding transcriptional regulator AlpA